MRKINKIELGATLFVPATHKDLTTLACGKKYPELKSMLIDTEDGIDLLSLTDAMKNIKYFLSSFVRDKVFIFIRPRDTKVLKELLACENIDKIDGFILPKFSLTNASEYFDILKDTKYYIMPSIEGEELFDSRKLLKLRDIILGQKKRILLVRFGLEDMLKQLSMRRKCEDSIFDFTATSYALGSFISTFKSVGFCVSGGVYPCFKDDEGFLKDIKRDLKEGLFSKTIIHPNQIKLSNKAYKPTCQELKEAEELIQNSHAIFSQNDKMAEVTTMTPWANEIIKRAEVYGVSDSS